MVGKHTNSHCRFMCWRGKQKERQHEKNCLQSVNQAQKDGYSVFCFVWLAQMIEGAMIFFSFSFFFMTTAL